MYSIEDIKKVPKKNLLRLIEIGKNHLKTSKVVQEMFNDYNVSLDYIDMIPCAFAELDVSAKTVKGVVYLSYKLVASGSFDAAIPYLVHEFDHVLKQISGEKATKNTDNMDGKNYLLSEEESEAFSRQIAYMRDEFGEVEADKYIEHLLDYHDINDSKMRDKTKDALTEYS
jgi:hypothetical protein